MKISRKQKFNQAIFNEFFKKQKNMTSIWTDPKTQAPPRERNPKSMFINSALGAGDSLVVTLTHLVLQPQEPGTQYPTEDGNEWTFYFEDEQGQERRMKQNTPRGKFYSAMRDARIEKGDKIKITRLGEGQQDTSYAIERVSSFEGFVPPTPPVNTPTKEIPY